MKLPSGVLTITETIGCSMYFDSSPAMYSWSWVAVLPTAGMSCTSGIVRRPSGRTRTLSALSSGLRQTWMVISSSGPMVYSSDGAIGFSL